MVSERLAFFAHLDFGLQQASNSCMLSHASGVSLVMFLVHCDRSRACEVCFVSALLCQGSCPDSLGHGIGESTEQLRSNKKKRNPIWHDHSEKVLLVITQVWPGDQLVFSGRRFYGLSYSFRMSPFGEGV